MENKNQRKKVNNAIYVAATLMLTAVVVIAVITGTGTANITEDGVVYESSESTPASESEKNESDSRSEVSGDSDSAEGEDGSAPSDESEEASAPVEFCLPVTGYISKDYSMDLPVFSLTMNDYRTHSGVDIQTSAGSAVAAIAEGTVTDRYTDPFMGICVEVTHGGGLVSKYMNLGEQYPDDAEVGCKVYCGQTIACVGDSAAVEAADTGHLHFELLKDGRYVDPIEYIGYEPMSDEGYEE